MTHHLVGAIPYEIRWHGRGGQGAVTSANLLAEAAFYAGFKGVTSAPIFGAERRGAPVTASTRLASESLRYFSQVEHPDLIVVLDDSLLETANAVSGLKSNGQVVVNSRHTPQELNLAGDFSLATADADKIALSSDLVAAGSVMVNTAMLGAVARATGLITLEHLERTFANAFSKRAAAQNLEAARLTYESTICA